MNGGCGAYPWGKPETTNFDPVLKRKAIEAPLMQLNSHKEPLGSDSPAWLASRRLAAVQTPVIPVVADLIRRHLGTISLGQGVVAYGPPPAALDQLGSFLADPQNHKYQPVVGIPPLLEALTDKLRQENGITIGPENAVVVTAGGNLAFMNALLAIADPGDEFILPVPFYFNHEMAITMANCRAVLVPTDENHQLRLDALRAAITARTRGIVTVSPNNPSGAVYPEADLRAVNELCRERGVFHLHDEAYEYFTFDEARHFSPASLPGSAAHTISLFSLSKAYGFASWRIGYQVIPAALLEAVRKVQDTLLICAPVISQFAAIGALRAGRAYCQAHLPAMAAVREVMLAGLSQLGSACYVPPASGAFYLLLRIDTPLSSLEVVTRLVRDFGVAVIPGSAFGLETGCYLRVAYGALSRETATAGIDRLVRGLRAITAG